MKANRLNLIAPVRATLVSLGISTVKVVCAVNAALGELNSEITGAKSGSGRTIEKGKSYAVTTSTSYKHTGKSNMPLLFDAWHSKVEAANKVTAQIDGATVIAEFYTIAIPSCFTEWLAKMKETPAVQENAPAPSPEAPEATPAVNTGKGKVKVNKVEPAVAS